MDTHLAVISAPHNAPLKSLLYDLSKALFASGFINSLPSSCLGLPSSKVLTDNARYLLAVLCQENPYSIYLFG